MLINFLSLLFVLFLPYNVSAEIIEENTSVRGHCDKISRKLASVRYKECLSHKFEIAESLSVKGSPIFVRNFYSASDENRPDIKTMNVSTHKRVLIIGGIHGNEYSSISIIFKWITILNQNTAGAYHWKIIPLLNPDGLLQKSSKRVNANGVDLDRNFSVETGADQETTPWEPESQWLAEEIERYKPDAIITVHAPNSSRAYKRLNNSQPALGAQYQKKIAPYPDSFNQYVSAMIDIPILTIELPYADVMPTQSEINEIWENLITWLNENV
ncbi:MAG: protein MpaA [Gammaproteobacteria bacterium]|jgi:protein MpaA